MTTLAPFVLSALLGNTNARHIHATTEQTIPLQVKLGIVTEIDFPRSEKILNSGEQRPRSGDPKFWDVTSNGNALYIRPEDDPLPVGGGRTTTISVTLASGAKYQFLASEISKTKGEKPDYRIILETEQSEQEAAQHPAFIPADSVKPLLAENEILHRYCEQPVKPVALTANPVPPSAEVNALNGLHFFDYEIYDVKGKAKEFRSVLFHNDRFTFIALSGLELPTVSAWRDGKFAKVQTTWVQNRYELPLLDEGMVQVGKDSFKFRRRK